MLDFQAFEALTKDLTLVSNLRDLVETNGAVQDRLANSSAGAKIKALSAQLDVDTDVERILATVADILSKKVILATLSPDLIGYERNPIYSAIALTGDDTPFTTIRLWNDKNITVDLTTYSPLDRRIRDDDRKRRSISNLTVSFPPNDTHYRILRSKREHLLRWRSDPISFTSAIHTELRCHEAPPIDINEGSSILLHGGAESLSFSEVNSCLTLLSVAYNRVRSPVIPTYYAATGKLKSVAASDDNSSRLEIMATLLRCMVGGEATAQLAPLLSHRDHFVRWYVAREIVAANATAALPLIRALTNDPHPQVAEAARATVAIIGESKNANRSELRNV